MTGALVDTASMVRPEIDPSLPTLVYNYYNLDPLWHQSLKANRILLLEPSVFERYPVANRNTQFAINLAKNIEGIQIYTGELQALKSLLANGKVIFKEHPLNHHYQGIQEDRDWMFEVTGFYPSFFAFWKRSKKEMK